MKYHVVGLALLSAVTVSVTACGSGAGSAPAAKGTTQSSSAAKAPLKTVTLRLDYIPTGYQAPFVYGAASGIYKKYGINLKWAWGTGSAASVQYVDAGKVMFGVGDATSVLKVDAGGGNVKMIWGFIQDNPASVIVPTSSKIKSGKDLAGATIAAAAGSATILELPALLHAAGVNPSSVHIDNMAASAEAPAVAAHKVDGELAYGFSAQPLLAEKGVQTRLINYSSYGVNPIDLGIVASTTTLQKDPQLVKEFLAATTASLKAAEANPKAAEQAVIANASGTAPALTTLEAQWKGVEKLFRTPNDKGQPTGWMSSKDWQETESLAKQYLGLKQAVSLSNVYTNQYLSSGS